MMAANPKKTLPQEGTAASGGGESLPGPSGSGCPSYSGGGKDLHKSKHDDTRHALRTPIFPETHDDLRRRLRDRAQFVLDNIDSDDDFGSSLTGQSRSEYESDPDMDIPLSRVKAAQKDAATEKDILNRSAELRARRVQRLSDPVLATDDTLLATALRQQVLQCRHYLQCGQQVPQPKRDLSTRVEVRRHCNQGSSRRSRGAYDKRRDNATAA